MSDHKRTKENSNLLGSQNIEEDFPCNDNSGTVFESDNTVTED